eukprot:scaffold28630_cov45-Isochrysis_galbana.AAC.1
MDQRSVRSTSRPTNAAGTTGADANASADRHRAAGQRTSVDVMPSERSMGEPSTLSREAARPAAAYNWPVR